MSSKVTKLQNQVDEVTNIMNANLSEIVNRGDELEKLKTNADDLHSKAKVFDKVSKDVRWNMRWKDMKMKLILAAIIVVILLIIIVTVVLTQKKN
ncbi:hypothetical protein HK100_000226 [Physocladia obscura]|uniref:V-SNARE coiled-coil homology domain-containing protein n=1 Tax=Physocladia obscura TaxID=109957 RepID=A0AAD5T867_9FUNG|nr:hypothetical protein HK100_000226 [Physocladia obscura]